MIFSKQIFVWKPTVNMVIWDQGRKFNVSKLVLKHFFQVNRFKLIWTRPALSLSLSLALSRSLSLSLYICVCMSLIGVWLNEMKNVSIYHQNGISFVFSLLFSLPWFRVRTQSMSHLTLKTKTRINRSGK